MKTIIPEDRPSELKEELTTYQTRIAEIRKHIGKHVLIHGSTIVDYYDKYAEALEAGYEMYGLANFMVREIRPVEGSTNVLRCSVKPVTGPLKVARRARRP